MTAGKKSAAGPRRQGRTRSARSAKSTRGDASPRPAAVRAVVSSDASRSQRASRQDASRRDAAGRDHRAADRREAIFAAALEEFSVKGFAATRLDDVARRAGIAKGTIYLYFKDKETLFQELLRFMFAPLVVSLENWPLDDQPVRTTLERMLELFLREVLATRRRDVIRLIIAEGARFPQLAEFHYREVVGRVFSVMSALMKRGVENGEVKHPAFRQFPQLVGAPGLLAVIWTSLFNAHAPLDVAAMMRAHLDIIFGERKAS